MKMQKVQFRIGELAKQLSVEKFVIRFWEKEFSVSTNRSSGGQRFYTQDDLEQFKKIKTLLYDQGFTIAGAKKLLADHASPDAVVGSYKTNIVTNETPTHNQPSDTIAEKILHLKQQLVALRDLL